MTVTLLRSQIPPPEDITPSPRLLSTLDIELGVSIYNLNQYLTPPHSLSHMLCPTKSCHMEHTNQPFKMYRNFSVSADLVMLDLLYASISKTQQASGYSGSDSILVPSPVVSPEPQMQELWHSCIHWGWALRGPLSFVLWLPAMLPIYCGVQFL